MMSGGHDAATVDGTQKKVQIPAPSVSTAGGSGELPRQSGRDLVGTNP